MSAKSHAVRETNGSGIDMVTIPEEQEQFLEAARRGSEYLGTARRRQPFPSRASIARLQDLGGDLPLFPGDARDIIRQLDEVGSPATVANIGGRYFGFVTGGTLPAARAASVLATAWDQNGGLRALSPVSAFLEDVCLGWLRSLLGLPGTAAGAFVTGATMASFTCLAAARHELLANFGWDAEANGLFGAPEIPVYVSADSHTSVLKALALLGLGRNRVVRLATDSQSRIVVAELPEIRWPSIVCIQAGDVNTGALDYAAEICDWARPSGSWVHVDGAFGLWATVSPLRGHLAAGFSKADSWATDAHKWLNVPYDSGLAFVRNADSLRRAMATQGAYLKLDEEREPSQFNPELSRRARAVEIWAAIRSLGKSGIAELIDRTCGHAQLFAQRLRESGFEILNEVVTNQVLVSFGGDEHTEAVVKALQQEGTCWCGSTYWKGRRAMRISVSSWSTTTADVEASVHAMIRADHSLRQTEPIQSRQVESGASNAQLR